MENSARFEQKQRVVGRNVQIRQEVVRLSNSPGLELQTGSVGVHLQHIRVDVQQQIVGRLVLQT